MIEQAIFNGIQNFQTEYNRAVNKKIRQIKTLREIGGKSAERLIHDVENKFDDDLQEMKQKHGARIRHFVSMIEDEATKKQVRYKVNLCIRCPEKVGTFRTEQEFFQWVRGSPTEIDDTNQKEGGQGHVEPKPKTGT